MGRAIGIRAFMERKFDVYDFEDEWKASFAYPEKNYKMLVYGDSGNGKTSFCVKLAKYMAQFTRVYYNSFEEGISKSLQDALVRENMMEVQGRVMFGDKESLDEMIQRLSQRNSPRCVIIDSRDYMDLTTAQYKKLVETFKTKSFIVTAWARNGKPKGEYAKAIEYMSDIKVYVDNYVAQPRCRYGGNVPFVIWDKGQRKRKPKTLFDT